MKIPHFIPNEPDNLHCSQCCYRMAVAALTGELVSLAQAEKETGFVSGLATWPYAALVSLVGRGLKVEQLEALPVRSLIQNPRQVCLDYFGPEAGEWVDKNTNWVAEIARIKTCLENPFAKITERPATAADIRRALAEDKVVMAGLNSRILNGKEGYCGHFVIVEDFRDGAYVLQNPGLPAFEHQQVPAELFEKAWACPTPSVANLTIVGKA